MTHLVHARMVVLFLALWLGPALVLFLEEKTIERNSARIEAGRREVDARACGLADTLVAQQNRHLLFDFEISKPTRRLLSVTRDPIERAYLQAVVERSEHDEWAPLTDCSQAILRDGRYVAPATIPFAKRLPPPSALSGVK